jgi:hypothetical protein
LRCRRIGMQSHFNCMPQLVISQPRVALGVH